MPLSSRGSGMFIQGRQERRAWHTLSNVQSRILLSFSVFPLPHGRIAFDKHKGSKQLIKMLAKVFHYEKMDLNSQIEHDNSKQANTLARPQAKLLKANKN